MAEKQTMTLNAPTKDYSQIGGTGAGIPGVSTRSTGSSKSTTINPGVSKRQAWEKNIKDKSAAALAASSASSKSVLNKSLKESSQNKLLSDARTKIETEKTARADANRSFLKKTAENASLEKLKSMKDNQKATSAMKKSMIIEPKTTIKPNPDWTIQGKLNDLVERNPHMSAEQAVTKIKDTVGYDPKDDSVYNLFYGYYKPRTQVEKEIADDANNTMEVIGNAYNSLNEDGKTAADIVNEKNETDKLIEDKKNEKLDEMSNKENVNTEGVPYEVPETAAKQMKDWEESNPFSDVYDKYTLLQERAWKLEDDELFAMRRIKAEASGEVSQSYIDARVNQVIRKNQQSKAMNSRDLLLAQGDITAWQTQKSMFLDEISAEETRKQQNFENMMATERMDLDTISLMANIPVDTTVKIGENSYKGLGYNVKNNNIKTVSVTNEDGSIEIVGINEVTGNRVYSTKIKDAGASSSYFEFDSKLTETLNNEGISGVWGKNTLTGNPMQMPARTTNAVLDGSVLTGNPLVGFEFVGENEIKYDVETGAVYSRKECGAFGNDALGVPGLFGNDLEEDKIPKINSQYPLVGSAVVFDNGTQYGHVGMVEKVWENGDISIVDANREGDGMFRRDKISKEEFDYIQSVPGLGSIEGFVRTNIEEVKSETEGLVSDDQWQRLREVNLGASKSVREGNNLIFNEAIESGDPRSIERTIKEAEMKKYLPRVSPYVASFEKGIKDWEEIEVKYNSMDTAYKHSQANPDEGYAFLDQALISLFNKITDPDSVVRESEFERTGKSLSIDEEVIGAAVRIFKGGGGLTDETRQAALAISKALADGAKSSFYKHRDKALAKAESALVPESFMMGQMGLNEDGEFNRQEEVQGMTGEVNIQENMSDEEAVEFLKEHGKVVNPENIKFVVDQSRT